jgi:hypothetical protein
VQLIYMARFRLGEQEFATSWFVWTCSPRFVKLYALRSATTKACLHKIATNYVVDIVRPDCILSDNGTQFSSPFWRNWE